MEHLELERTFWRTKESIERLSRILQDPQVDLISSNRALLRGMRDIRDELNQVLGLAADARIRTAREAEKEKRLAEVRSLDLTEQEISKVGEILTASEAPGAPTRLTSFVERVFREPLTQAGIRRLIVIARVYEDK